MKGRTLLIGYFPAPDPKFIILVKLKAPEANTAEYSSMPVFNELVKYVIYVSQLPSTEEIKIAELVAQAGGQNSAAGATIQ